MPRSCAAARLRSRAFAILLSLFLSGSLAPSAGASPSPFPPYDIGAPQGGSASFDLVVPLSLSVASIPASYDSFVLFDTGDAATILALDALGFSVPVTIGQVKTLLPAAAISMAVPTVALTDPSGAFALQALGCSASECGYRVTFEPPGPGSFNAHVEAAVANVTIENGGLLGALLSLLYPFAADFINGFLHYDVVGAALASPAAIAARPVPGLAMPALLLLGGLLAAAGAMAVRRRPGQRRQAGGR